jgi:hypothetical protein
LYLYIYLENWLGKYSGKCTEISWHMFMILTFINKFQFFFSPFFGSVWKFVTHYKPGFLLQRKITVAYTFLIVRISASWSDGPLLIEDVESKFGLLLFTNTLSMSVLESFKFWFQNFVCVTDFMLLIMRPAVYYKICITHNN